MCVAGCVTLPKHMDINLNLHFFIPSMLIVCNKCAMYRGRTGDTKQECYVHLSYLSSQFMYLRLSYPTEVANKMLHGYGYHSGHEKCKQRIKRVTSNDVNNVALSEPSV